MWSVQSSNLKQSILALKSDDIFLMKMIVYIWVTVIVLLQNGILHKEDKNLKSIFGLMNQNCFIHIVS